MQCIEANSCNYKTPYIFSLSILTMRENMKNQISKSVFPFSKMDKNKCPKMKRENTFGKKETL